MNNKNTEWKIIEGDLLSKWAHEVDPNNVLPEYPRPNFVRTQWQNLNGLWEYAILDKEVQSVQEFEGNILVPFPVESALSGVKRPLLPTQRLWYKRTFSVPENWQFEKILLHFGAVDYQTNVWLNGIHLGEHLGGSLPFTFEISNHLNSNQPNQLVVAVWDPSDQGNQQRGKQVLNPKGIWYTATSGIWQTVWMEPVSENFIKQIKITPNIDQEKIQIKITLNQEPNNNLSQRIKISFKDKVITEINKKNSNEHNIEIPSPHLWHPDTPHLYDIELKLFENKEEIDHITSYFGMRKFHIAQDKDGYKRIFINNQPLFQYGPLDQGYWPDGLYTPPTDEAMLSDILYAKKIGCNMIRKHIKIEPARWYYYCDKVGMIVWQDMPNGGRPIGGLTTLLAMNSVLNSADTKHYKRAGRQDSQNRNEYKHELIEMVDWLYNSPSIAVWVLFNEAWGQFDAKKITKILKKYDSSRLIDHASGWFDQNVGDFQSKHTYFTKLKAFEKDTKRAFIISEFGGYSLLLSNHAWITNKKFSYRHFRTKEKLTQAYTSLLEKQLIPLREKGLAAAVYTQTTDVEIEINGFLSYDRKEEKMMKDELKEIHKKLYK